VVASPSDFGPSGQQQLSGAPGKGKRDGNADLQECSIPARPTGKKRVRLSG
jgi:hypothetical protein